MPYCPYFGCVYINSDTMSRNFAKQLKEFMPNKIDNLMPYCPYFGCVYTNSDTMGKNFAKQLKEFMPSSPLFKNDVSSDYDLLTTTKNVICFY